VLVLGFGLEEFVDLSLVFKTLRKGLGHRGLRMIRVLVRKWKYFI